jgi:hypothetical protein
MNNDKNPAAVALGSLGGKARAEKLSARERRAIAKKASEAAKKKRKEKKGGVQIV